MNSVTSAQNHNRQIVTVKTVEKESESSENTSIQSTAWLCLTLGMPLLLNTISQFWSDLNHRETCSQPLNVHFNCELLSTGKMGRLIRFNQFNQVFSTPLNDAVEKRALQKMQKAINSLEEAKNGSDDEAIVKYQNKINELRSILTKNITPSTTRNHFTKSDWTVVDSIEFELVQEYFEELTDLFNRRWFLASGLHDQMKTGFGVDYNEALIAESLALSLAYIEGLEGKSLFLPVFDNTTDKYQSVPFTIKTTVLGDALPCYILESDNIDNTPWFVVRGTQRFFGVYPKRNELRQGGLESVLASSLSSKCVSKHVINKALVFQNKSTSHETLGDVFYRWRKEGKTVNLSGHSLGGTLVNALAIEFYDQLKFAYAFSGAGVSFKLAHKWAQCKKQRPDLSLDSKLINFAYENDFIPCGGRKLIGSHLAIGTIEKVDSQQRVYYHGLSHLNRNFKIQKVDVRKEEMKWARYFCEGFRIVTGKCFRILLKVFFRQFVPDWWKNRKVYRLEASTARNNRLTF